MMNKRLIVNADDYGRTGGVSKGIRTAHLTGIVTSTTAMINLPGVEYELEQALDDCPRLGLGVHLVLTAGEPLLPSHLVSSITGGKDHFPSAQQFIRILPGIDVDQVRSEWEAQIQKFIQLTGKNPDHLDSHHHTSYFSQPLFRVMLELARELDCAIRLPLAEGGDTLPLDLPAELGDQPVKFIPALLDEFSPRVADIFFSSFYNQYATRENLIHLLSQLPDGTSELMCHPGFADSELVESSAYNVKRQVELDILIDPEIRNLIQDRAIQLINYTQL